MASLDFASSADFRSSANLGYEGLRGCSRILENLQKDSQKICNKRIIFNKFKNLTKKILRFGRKKQMVGKVLKPVDENLIENLSIY